MKRKRLVQEIRNDSTRNKKLHKNYQNTIYTFAEN